MEPDNVTSSNSRSTRTLDSLPTEILVIVFHHVFTHEPKPPKPFFYPTINHAPPPPSDEVDFAADFAVNHRLYNAAIRAFFEIAEPRAGIRLSESRMSLSTIVWPTPGRAVVAQYLAPWEARITSKNDFQLSTVFFANIKRLEIGIELFRGLKYNQFAYCVDAVANKTTWLVTKCSTNLKELNIAFDLIHRPGRKEVYARLLDEIGTWAVACPRGLRVRFVDINARLGIGAGGQIS